MWNWNVQFDKKTIKKYVFNKKINICEIVKIKKIK